MININNEKYLTKQEVSQILKISTRAVDRLVKLKKLNAFKPSSNKTFFTEKMIEQYLTIGFTGE